MSGESIKVCCRFRKEFGEDELYDDWIFNVDEAEIKLKEKKWTYDYILPPHTEQDEMYEKVAKQTITDFMNGFNGTIFAYGQSGSGKTFSMLGPEDVTHALAKDFHSVEEKVTQLYGITPRAVIQMFETINKFVSNGSSCTLICSYIEIYNETIKCLLSKKDNLKIREQPGMGMNVADKEVKVCKTPEQIFEVISIATNNRAVTGTNQNARSSRSHTILLLEFEYNGVDGVKRNSRLNLVDLAGSERISKTGAEGQTLKEAQKINQSLTTLGMCIMALTTSGSKHIPFRNSKLTLILKESLGGNSKTTLLCTASRKKEHTEESTQTLYFASRAKAIKNNCKSNVQMGAKELQYIADFMKKEVTVLRGQLKKAGVNWNLINDPKILAFISNNEYEMDGELGGDITNVDLTDDNPRNRRISLMNLTEKDIIIKYCELRAKYDNLLENAGNKIYELNSKQKTNIDPNELSSIRIETDEKLKEIVDAKNSEINSLHDKLEQTKKESEVREDELNQKIQELMKEKLQLQEERDSAKKDHDTVQEMCSLNQNDISALQEKLAKKKKKIATLKEEIANLKAENSNNNTTIEELNKRISEADAKNLEQKQKLDEVNNKNELLIIEVENLKNLLKQKEDNEQLHANRNKELQEEITRNLESIGVAEKNLSEMNNKYVELDLKFKSEMDLFANRDTFCQTQIETLKKENENLNKLMQDKISDQELLNEKEKILSETKSSLEGRIQEHLNEIQKLKNELLEYTTKTNSEKSELTLQIDNLNRELKNKNSEIEHRDVETENFKKSNEEMLRSETLKVEQLQLRLDTAEKKANELEVANLNLSETEKKLTSEKQSLEREIKEKVSLLAEQKDSLEKYTNMNDNNEKLVKELRDNLTELNIKLKEELDNEKKKLVNEQTLLKNEIEYKTKKLEDSDKRVNELKTEIKVLQDMNQRNQNRINELEIDNTRTKKMSTILQKETHVIKEKAPLNKNIFGVLLKKTDNPILKQAREENKTIQKKAEDIYSDKIAELKGLRENILSLSPKTVSSRSDIGELPELDFEDEESFKKAEVLLLEKENAYQEEKLKKELEKKKETGGMII